MPPASAAPASSASAPAPAPAAQPSPDERIAREQFIKGTELLQTGDVDGALLRFLDSRAHFRSFANTANAAVCLEKLGRFDEALDMYRELVADFSSKFTEEERRNIAGITASLRKKVGSLDVSSNVDGLVVIDSRVRGTLPLLSPISLLEGRHRVRVLKEGYGSGEAEVEIKAGSGQSVELKLAPLTDVGKLLVRESSGKEGLEVLVDGAPVGKTPWKGTLAQGAHLVALRGKEEGTAPTSVSVLVGQELEKALAAEPLGAEVVLRPEPSSASLTIDGVAVGHGVWQGRLPRRPHAVAASEVGYFDGSLSLGGDEAGVRDVVLRVDRKHPRWPREPTGSFTAGVFALGGLSVGTNSDPERNCGQGCEGGPPLFLSSFVRAGYAFLGGWRAEVSLGAARFGRALDRKIDDGGRTLSVRDELSTQGLWITAGGGYAAAVSSRVSLVPRLALGVGIFGSRDQAKATAIGATDQADMVIDQSGASVRNNPLLMILSFDVEGRWGNLRLTGGLGIPTVLGSGPTLPHGEAAVVPVPTSGCQPSEARCGKGTLALQKPVAYRPTAFVAPTLGVAYHF